jgi:hypothetical protein
MSSSYRRQRACELDESQISGAGTIAIGHCPCLLVKYALRYRPKSGSSSESGVTPLPWQTGGSMLRTFVLTRNMGESSFQVKRVPGLMNPSRRLISGWSDAFNFRHSVSSDPQ